MSGDKVAVFLDLGIWDERLYVYVFDMNESNRKTNPTYCRGDTFKTIIIITHT